LQTTPTILSYPQKAPTLVTFAINTNIFLDYVKIDPTIKTKIKMTYNGKIMPDFYIKLAFQNLNSTTVSLNKLNKRSS
jgi:hypothetical protein